MHADLRSPRIAEPARARAEIASLNLYYSRWTPDRVLERDYFHRGDGSLSRFHFFSTDASVFPLFPYSSFLLFSDIRAH